MQITLINNNGGGFARTLDIEDGTTVVDFFNAEFPGESPHSWKIRVNREPVTASTVLQDGDRLVVTPTKMEGGFRA